MMVSAGKHRSRDGLETEPEPERPAPKPVPKIDELPAAHVEPSAIELEPSAAAASNQTHPVEVPAKLPDLMAPESAAAATALVWPFDPILVGWQCYESIFGWTDA